MKHVFILTAGLFFAIASFAQIAPYISDTAMKHKVREVGLVFSSLNSFGLCYKFGNENTVFRITAFSSIEGGSRSSYNSDTYNGAIDTVPSSPSSSFSAGLSFGMEKRKKINDRFYFYYGLVLINSYTESKSTIVTPTNFSAPGYFNSNNVYIVQSVVLNNTNANNVWSISSGVGIVAGVTYKISNSFSIGAELIPSVSYNYGETKIVSTSYSVAWTSHGSSSYTADEYKINSAVDKIIKGISYSVINAGASITIAYRIK